MILAGIKPEPRPPQLNGKKKSEAVITIKPRQAMVLDFSVTNVIILKQ